jgi:aryl-alcohol dehydrogenase-like predicted oxidoreductase
LEKRRLGNSDMEITTLGYGAWAIGGPWKFGWGPQDDDESIRSIHEALDLGINWVDTAAVYGLGKSETMVARALAEWSGAKPYVFTKCERVWGDDGQPFACLKGESIRKEIEGSLRRLRIDVIDLYQVHWPQPDEDIEEGWSTLAELQREGKVRHIGVSNFNASQMKRAQAIAPITSLQPPYSLLNRGVEQDILPFCRDNNIGVIVYSPMASGLLSGAMSRERVAALAPDDWRTQNPNFQEPALSRNLGLADLLATIGARHYRSAGEVAIAWTLRHPAVTAAIVGLRKSGQAAGVVGAASLTLSGDEVGEIDRYLAR